MVHTVSVAITGPAPTHAILLVDVVNALTSERVVANVIKLLPDGDPDWLVLKILVGNPALVVHVGLLLSMGLLSPGGKY